MRASEFISEGKIHKNVKRAMPGTYLTRDSTGLDSDDHCNRLGMAMAMADGKSKKAVNMDSGSWAAKYNTIHPYTKCEHNMVIQAMNTVPTSHKHIVSDHRSLEAEDTHKISPVSSFKGYNYKKKNSKK